MENDRYQPEKYDADEVGFYTRNFFDNKYSKVRPLDFDDHGVHIDEPGRAATRAQWRNHNDRLNAGWVHFNTRDLSPMKTERFENPLYPGVEVKIPFSVDWEDLPEDH